MGLQIGRRLPLVLGAVLSAAAVATVQAGAPPEPARGEVRTVQLHVVLPGGEALTAMAVVEDGGSAEGGRMITIEEPKLGKLGLVPTVGSDGTLNLQVLELHAIGAREVATLVQVVPLQVGAGAQAAFVAGQRLEVTALAVDSCPLSEPPSNMRPVEMCCVTCGNTTGCGCAVSMSCGSCCNGVCCD